MTYITKYSDKNGTKAALTEQKINACLISLENNINAYTPKETVQNYAVFEWSGTYFKGTTVLLEKEFEKPYNIWTDIDGLHLRIGNFQLINGQPFAVFEFDKDRTDHIIENSVTMTESGTYETEWSRDIPSQPSDEESTTTESYSKSGSSWTETGTITYTVNKHYSNWRIQTRGSPQNRSYKGTATWTKQYSTKKEYDRAIHLGDISIYMEYPIKRQ